MKFYKCRLQGKRFLNGEHSRTSLRDVSRARNKIRIQRRACNNFLQEFGSISASDSEPLKQRLTQLSIDP